MRVDGRKQAGSVLIEGVIALTVLCLVIVTLMMITATLIRGKAISGVRYEEAFLLNTIRDRIAADAEIQKPEGAEKMRQIADRITADYSGWQSDVISEQPFLYLIRLTHQRNNGEVGYEIKIYVPTV